MDCPKCGAVQDGERDDCGSCGIVFARWREAQERALLGRGRNTQATPMEHSGGVPLWMVGIALLLAVLFGVMWTRWRRAERAKVDLAAVGKKMVNDRNKEIIEARKRFSTEAERARALSGGNSRAAAPRPRPLGFSESDATVLLEQCSAFAEPLTLSFPKTYPKGADRATLNARYPHLALAENRGVLARNTDWNIVRLSAGPASAGMRFVDSGDQYLIELGMRRIERISEFSGGADTAAAGFRWTYEDRVATAIFLEKENFDGRADFVKNGGVWRVKEAVFWGGPERVTKICQ